MAGQIHATPLTRSEAYTIYTERFKSTFFYPLAVTQFTKHQSHQIQSKIYQQLLPKLGYNRHTPLAVILGPYKYGGSNLATYYNEQHIQHIERMLRYIRQNCYLGQLYLTSIEQYQQYIGTELPIFSQPSTNFQYGEKHIVKYIWDACTTIHLTLDIPNLHTSPPTYSNDRFIMDLFIHLNLDDYTLRILNNVRLWLRVEKMSDIFHHTTQQLHLWVSNVTRQNSTPLNWPLRRKPSPTHISIWKTNIYKLCRGIREPLHPFGTPLQPLPNQCPSFTLPHLSPPTLATFISSLPPYLLDFFCSHPIGLPLDDTTTPTIVKWLTNDELIAATDGSAPDGLGSHAYGFTSSTCFTTIVGSAMRTPGNRDEMTSLRAEHGGVITIL